MDAREADGEDTGGLTEQAKAFAKEKNCICVISGKRDIITDGKALIYVNNGSPWMSSPLFRILISLPLSKEKERLS